MSGIVAVLRTDGAAVEACLVGRLTDSLRLRGPDAQNTWCDGPVGLGHALLRTTFEAGSERQPLSLDGRVWIVADGRVDARGDLIRALGSDGTAFRDSPDAELILRAYLRWGRQCVEHLLGDFAFVVWDGLQRRLFCARDHMGVKPFYYAHVGRWLLVSSTIEALRLHPQVSGELNDLAIADFLMFGFNQEHSTTSFRDIQRLPPAHTLTSSSSGVVVEGYWTLPIEEPVYRRRNDDYVDEFKDVVRQAVEDRLRVPRVGVFMSGGLDSPMLAATAQHVLRDGSSRDPVHAFTFVYESLFADPEREDSKAVAERLGIPIHQYVLDGQPGWFPEQGAQLPEPSLGLMDRSQELRCYRESAQHSPVAFFGEGPDNALCYEWRPHLKRLCRARRFVRLAADIGQHVVLHRRVPLLPSVPRMLSTLWAQKQNPEQFPDWLEPNLVSRLNLRERWRAVSAGTGFIHPWRPRGYRSLLSAQWQGLFEGLEPAYTGAALEVRHPYVDIRVLRCMLSVPALPWCRSKHVLRTALRGVVPERTRRRTKKPLAANPLREHTRRSGLPGAGPSILIRKYGNDESRLPLVALSHWLNRHTSNQHSSREKEQEDHGTKITAHA